MVGGSIPVFPIPFQIQEKSVLAFWWWTQNWYNKTNTNISGWITGAIRITSTNKDFNLETHRDLRAFCDKGWRVSLLRHPSSERWRLLWHCPEFMSENGLRDEAAGSCLCIWDCDGAEAWYLKHGWLGRLVEGSCSCTQSTQREEAGAEGVTEA